MGDLTFKSGLKKGYNKWITISSNGVELLKKESILSLLSEVYDLNIFNVYATVCWNFKDGTKSGYKVTIHIESEKDAFEVALVEDWHREWLGQHIFKTLDAAHNFILKIGFDSFRVDFG